MKLKICTIFVISTALILSFCLTSWFEFSLISDDLDHNNKNLRNSSQDPVSYLWNTTWGGSREEEFRGLQIDNSDNLFLGGYTEVSSSSFDMLLVRYDVDGIEQWNRKWGGTSNEKCNALAIDSLNNVYLIGYTTSYGAGQTDLALVKYDQNGSLKWSRTWGGWSYDNGLGIAIDSSGNVYITGYTYSFGNGQRDVCTVKYNNFGDQLWNRTWGAAGAGSSEVGYAIGFDSLENVYVVGYTTSVSNTNVLIIKYDTLGVQQWVKTWGGSNVDYCYGIAVDSSDNLYLTGATRSYGAGSYDSVIVKYDNLGNYLWRKTWGGSGAEFSRSIVLDSEENILIAGETNSFGSGGTDFFLLKYNVTGDLRYSHLWGGVNDDECKSIALDTNENLYLSGFTESIGAGISDGCLVKYQRIATMQIILPKPFETFGLKSPYIKLYLYNWDEYDIKYTLNDGINNTFSGIESFVDQDEWYNCPDGNVEIRFYANTTDLTLIDQINVTKNTQIVIYEPINGENFDFIPPQFNISIIDRDLYNIWYSLNGGINYTFTGNEGIINKTYWYSCQTGNVSIQFYANDTYGNIQTIKIIVHKNFLINIDSPYFNQNMFKLAPYFNISISTNQIDSTWYSLNDGNNYTFSGTDGFINQTVWDEYSDGNINIRFYSNNTLGYITSSNVTVYKHDQLLAKNAYAIVIGISDYPGSGNDLNYCDEDALEVYSMLINDYNFRPENIIYLQDSSATKNGITNAFNTIESLINPDDLFFFYYSGHGGAEITTSSPSTLYIQSPHYYPNNYDRTWWVSSTDAAYIRVHFELFDLENGYDYLYLGDADIADGWYYQELTGYSTNFWSDWIPVLNDNRIYLRMVTDYSYTNWGFRIDQIQVQRYSDPHYLCSYDSLPNNPSNYYTDSLLNAQISSLKNDETYVILDSCNSGGMISEIQGTNRYIMSACKGGQFSMEEPTLGNGIFTYYLIESINNTSDQNLDGVVSMDEYFTYISSKTKSYSSGYGPGIIYHPQMYNGMSHEAVLHTVIGSISLNTIDNELYYSFQLYGHGSIRTLNMTVCSVYPEIIFREINLIDTFTTPTGFGYYSGIIEFDEGYIPSGVIIYAEIEGYRLLILNQTYGDYDEDGLTDFFEIFEGNGLDPNSNDTDSDGLSDYDEVYGLTDPLNNDTDSDGLLDGEEVNTFGTDPLLDDTDSDGLTDYDEINIYSTDPLNDDTDSDGLTDYDEIIIHGTDPLNDDMDSDGLTDGDEIIIYFTDPLNNDTDSDNLTDSEEVLVYNTDPLNDDTDSDGLTDYDEIIIHNTDPLNDDTDSDGLTDYDEIIIHNTDPLNDDTDSDTIPDGWEVSNLLDPLTNDTALDPDNDLLTNLEEYQHDTLPFNNDTDSDGLLDGEEVNNYNTGPLQEDTDSDGLLDGEEVNTHNTNPLQEDTDSDGLLDGEEVNTHNTNPLQEDTDLDGLLDGEEVNSYNTDPLSGDTDSDTMPDKWEVDNLLNPLVNDTTLDPDNDLLMNILEYQHGTNPQDPDTDNDNWTDGDEVLVYDTDPLDPDDHPNPRQDQAIPGYPLGFVIIITAITVTIWLIGYMKKRSKR